MTIECCRSIPDGLPVIPWHTLVLQNEDPPNDETFIRLVSHRGDSDLTAELAKYADHVKLTAILLISDANVQDISAPKDISAPNDKVPLLIIPLRHYDKIKQFIKSFKSRELEVSSIPLCAAEIKQKSQGLLSACICMKFYTVPCGLVLYTCNIHYGCSRS